ncbi:hypothetical protein CRENBAI_021846 [Crenichthys baileyi]|uniref:Uncharacterized protein n=1 Tax=Crenichthys baileyi TaxID=28760 RepID=A0AAV9RIA2_9TELE
MEDSPPRLVQSLFTGCSNQRQARTPPWPIISQVVNFKDPLHGRHRSSAELRRSAATCPTSFWRLGGSSHCFVTNARPPSSSSACRSVRLASCLDGPFSPRLSSGHVESTLRTPPILLLSVAEVALPSPRLPTPRHPARLLQRFSSDLVSQTDLPGPQASTSSSTPVIPQSSLLHSSRPWILSRASYLPLLSFSGTSPSILPHQHFLFLLRQRSTRSLAPLTSHTGSAPNPAGAAD